MSLYARKHGIKGRKPKKNYDERFCEHESCDIKLSIYNKKKFYVLDINPRFGGGYPFTHVYGYNYIECLISLVLKNKKIKFKIFNRKKNIFSKGITIYPHGKK